jgi:hypothetical protein
MDAVQLWLAPGARPRGAFGALGSLAGEVSVMWAKAPSDRSTSLHEAR